MRARNNRGMSVDPTVTSSLEDIERGAEDYSNWHWGEPTTRVLDWKDPDYPDMLVGCGKLVRLQIRAPHATNHVKNNRSHPRRQQDTQIQFSRAVSSGSYLAFDPNHPNQRLYLCIAGPAMAQLEATFWASNSMPPMRLGDVAGMVGGRHGNPRDYPEIPVKPIGILTAIVYQTTKKGDGLSYYIHQVGEISKLFPVICCDEQGRLWIAGANTTSPTPGVTD